MCSLLEVCGVSAKGRRNKIRDNCSIIRVWLLCCCCLAVIIVCSCSYLMPFHWRGGAEICSYQPSDRRENKLCFSSLKCDPVHVLLQSYDFLIGRGTAYFYVILIGPMQSPLQISFRLNGDPICSNGFAGAMLPIKFSNDFLYQDNR